MPSFHQHLRLWDSLGVSLEKLLEIIYLLEGQRNLWLFTVSSKRRAIRHQTILPNCRFKRNEIFLYTISVILIKLLPWMLLLWIGSLTAFNKQEGKNILKAIKWNYLSLQVPETDTAGGRKPCCCLLAFPYFSLSICCWPLWEQDTGINGLV